MAPGEWNSQPQRVESVRLTPLMEPASSDSSSEPEVDVKEGSSDEAVPRFRNFGQSEPVQVAVGC